MRLSLEIVEGLIGRADAPDWHQPLDEACQLFDIDSQARISAFLAQCAHESSGFISLEENLNYSWERLMVVFPKYFRKAATAHVYERKPEAIANRVYANRLGNGDELSGDGWKYRGRGLIQLTGAENYRRCGIGLGVDLLTDPDLLTTYEHAAGSAAWFWDDRGCNVYADSGDFEGLTRRINGGINGLDDRLAWLDKIDELMA